MSKKQSQKEKPLAKASLISCCRNFLKKSNQFISNHKSLSIFFLTLIIFAGIGYATTINEGGVFNAGQLTFGNTSGTFNETMPNRELVSNYPKTISVCTSGCDYTTIQDAVNQVPLILRHQYVISIKDGTYAEDVYIPPIILSRTQSSEGSVGGIQVIGNNSNINGVKVRSFQINGALGSIGVYLRSMNIYGEEPHSDENTSISVYSSNTVELTNLNISSTVDFGFLSYGSRVNSNNVTFNGNIKHGAQAKNMGTIIFGDSYLGSGNKGSVTQELVKSDDGSYIFIENNSVSYIGSITTSDGHGIVIDSDNFRLWNIKQFGEPLTLVQTLSATANTTIIVNNSADYALKVRNTGTSGRALQILSSTGTGIFQITDSQLQILASLRFNIVANTSARTCSGSQAGDLYYDGSTFKHYGCNSTGWNALY